MHSDVAEAARVKVRFDKQDEELGKLTKMVTALSDSDRRRTEQSMKMAAVKEEDDRRKKERDKNIERLVKLWPVLLVIAPIVAAFGFWVIRVVLAKASGGPMPAP